MDDTLRDPVCGAEVSYETAQARSDYDGQTFYFDSLECKEKFDQNPEQYVTHQHESHNY
jgi:YHS domain-containing protein